MQSDIINLETDLEMHDSISSMKMYWKVRAGRIFIVTQPEAVEN